MEEARRSQRDAMQCDVAIQMLELLQTSADLKVPYENSPIVYHTVHQVLRAPTDRDAVMALINGLVMAADEASRFRSTLVDQLKITPPEAHVILSG